MHVESITLLGDTAIARLRPGDQVVVHRYLPPSDDRDAELRAWQVTIADLHSLGSNEGWVLVPAAATPAHPVDFYIGSTIDGMQTWIALTE